MQELKSLRSYECSPKEHPWQKGIIEIPFFILEINFLLCYNIIFILNPPIIERYESLHRS
jgi:hypothetical protein